MNSSRGGRRRGLGGGGRKYKNDKKKKKSHLLTNDIFCTFAVRDTNDFLADLSCRSCNSLSCSAINDRRFPVPALSSIDDLSLSKALPLSPSRSSSLSSRSLSSDNPLSLDLEVTERPGDGKGEGIRPPSGRLPPPALLESGKVRKPQWGSVRTSSYKTRREGQKL